MVQEDKMVIILLFVLKVAGHLICIIITETLTAPEQKTGVHRTYWTICFRVSWSPPKSNAHLSVILIAPM